MEVLIWQTSTGNFKHRHRFSKGTLKLPAPGAYLHETQRLLPVSISGSRHTGHLRRDIDKVIVIKS